MEFKEDRIKNIVLPFKDKLYRFALNIVSDTYDAEDIMQELMIKIWKRWEQFQEIENQEAWCMTVTRNMAIDKVRSRKAPMQDIDTVHTISDSEATPDKAMEKSERMGFIMKILNELPDKQRTIVHLRDIEGYTYQEIADITETTLDFVKVSLHRARKTMKEKLIQRNFKRND